MLADEQALALKQAASYGDYYQLLEILDGVAAIAKGPLLEAVLCMREMVEKYDYEGLENLLESRGNHDG